jgi:O-antigen/teichoic acid export membrane protein
MDFAIGGSLRRFSAYLTSIQEMIASVKPKQVSAGGDLNGTVIAKNSIISFIGLALPLVVGFVAIPYVIRSLGTTRFGILSLVWIVFGYFGLFDLGMGRTTTKYIAEALGKGETEKLPFYLWTTVLLQTAIGLAGAGLLIVVAPLVARRFLNIPAEFVEETIQTLRLVGLSLPVMFVTSSFRGVLEAGQRFGLVNVVKIPINVLFYILPLVGIALGYELPGIVVLLVISRLAALCAWAAMSVGVFPVLRRRPVMDRTFLKPLFSFSGWLALSSIVYSISSSLDRLLIGSLLTIEAVTYYSAPYEAINRIGIIPGSLSMVLFPAFSYLGAGRYKERVEELFARSTKFILLSTGPIFILLMFFAGDFLRLWLGPDFARTSVLVVQFLAAGFLINSMIAVPNNYLLGIGRADIAPKYQVVELVGYAALTWVGAKLWGIKGVALAAAVRLVFFAVFLMAASFKVGGVGFQTVWKSGVSRACCALALFAGCLAANSLAGLGIWGAGFLTMGFAATVYFKLLERREREFLTARFRFKKSAGPASAVTLERPE